MAKLIKSVLFRNSFIPAVQQNLFNRTFHISALKMIGVGESIPSATLYEGPPNNSVDIAEICKDKKVIVIGVPGAFTPGCSKVHLPGYIEKYVELKKKGVDEIICVSVNDVFVMEAWAKDQDALGKVRMLSDPDASFTKILGLDIDIPGLGGVRSKRYAMIVEKGVIKTLHVEPDGTGLSCSLAPKLPL